MRYNWTQVQLSDIMNFKNGKKRPNTSGNIPVYGGNGVLGFAGDANNQNCVIIGRVGAYCGSVFRGPQKCWVSDNAICCTAKENSDIVFDYYLLKSLHLNERHIGTSQPLLTQEILNRIEILCPSLGQQRKIGTVLSRLDDKIELNQKINENLQQQAFTLFDRLLSTEHSSKCPLSEIAIINPKRILKKGESARYIDMAQLSTSSSFPNGWEIKPYNGGMRFSNGDTLLARITPCLENGKTAFIDFLNESEVAFGSTEYVVISSRGEYPPEFFYCLARYPAFVDYAVKNMNGSSGRQRVSAETIGNYILPVLTENELLKFRSTVPCLFKMMRNSSIENMRLTQLRDTLLPRLMSGEIDVSAIPL